MIKKLEDCMGFFHALYLADIGAASAEEYGKYMGVEVPELLKGAHICAPLTKPTGNHNFVLSNMPLLGWATPFFAKTKCVLLCYGEGENMTCLHLCITCLDSWPGPGCYIHGSWN